MTGDIDPFSRRVRETLDTSASDRLVRAQELQTVIAERSQRDRIRREATPLVAQQIRTDAFAFARLMQEKRYRPYGHALRVAPEVWRSTQQSPAGDQASIDGTRRDVWIIGWDGRARLDASAPSRGASFYTYRANIAGVAMDVQGFLWRFTQEQQQELGYSDSAPGCSNPTHLNWDVDAVRLATDEDLLEGDNWGASRYISKAYVQPIMSGAPEDQPVVQDFQDKLLRIAAAAARHA